MADYIKLPRSSLTDEILRDEKLCRLYLNLLARADENGCAEISVREFARECKLSYQTMRTLFNRLLATQVLTRISTQKLTQFSLCGTAIKTNSPTRKSTQDSTQKPTKFTPPTDEEVIRYVAEKGYHFNPAQFVPFYQSKGWMIGKNPMKDWRAACRTWEIEWGKKHGEQFYNQIAPEAIRQQQTGRYSAIKHAATAILQQPGNIDPYFNDKADTPNLWKLKKEIGVVKTRAIVIYALVWAAELVNVERNLTDSQIGECANDIVEEYGYLKVEEIKYILKQAIRENKIFGRLDYAVVMKWFEDYANIRMEYCIDISEQEALQQANRITVAADAMSLDEYKAILTERAASGDAEAADRLRVLDSMVASGICPAKSRDKEIDFKKFFYNYAKKRKGESKV